MHIKYICYIFLYAQQDSWGLETYKTTNNGCKLINNLTCDDTLLTAII